MRGQAGRVLGFIIFVLGCGMLLAADAKAAGHGLKKVAIQGDSAPESAGIYTTIYRGVSLNDSKSVGYVTSLSGGTATQATWVAHSDGSFEVILTTDAPPGVPVAQFGFMGVPRLNNSGEFAFGAGLATSFNNFGWFVQRETGLELVAREGDPVPGIPGATWKWGGGAEQASMLPDGKVLLGTPINRNPGHGSGLFFYDAGSFEVAVTDGDVMPLAGSPTFTSVSPYAGANTSGDMVFYGGGGPGIRGVFARVGGSLTAIAVEGDPAPGSPSSTYSFPSSTDPTMNEAGQFAFVAYREPVGGGGQLSTLFFVEPGGSVSIALKPGDPIPGQGGRAFSDFGHPVINAAGEFAFSGRSLDDDNNSISGLYVWRQGQVDVVLESGREAPGSGGATIDTFYYKSVGFNDLGDVAFIATLDDGRRGVFLATSIEASVPALMPGALFALAAGLAGIGGISLLRQRRSP